MSCRAGVTYYDARCTTEESGLGWMSDNEVTGMYLCELQASFVVESYRRKDQTA